MRVPSQTIFARTRRIDKLYFQSVSHVVEMAIPPNLERIGSCRAAAFIARAIVCAARRMSFYGIRFPPCDVDAAAVGSPSGNARRKMFVRVSDPLVILLAVFVLFCVRIRIAA